MKKHSVSPSGIVAAQRSRAKLIDPVRFGPWALVTGASAGIGQDFARQLAEHGINLVLAARRVAPLAGDTKGPTDTPALEKLGIESPPMKPMPVAQCVTEAPRALHGNRATIVPGRLIRLMVALVPASVARDQTAKTFEAALKRKPSTAPSAAEKTS